MSCNLLAQCKESEIEVCLLIKGSRDMCSSCGKKHIDLRNDVEWKTQIEEVIEEIDGKTKKSYKVYRQCFAASKDILTTAGLSEKSAPNDGTVIKIVSEISGVNEKDKKDQAKYLQIDLEKAKAGLAYIDEQLAEAYPVLVGVDYKHGNTYNEGTTDHFIVIVGRGCNDGKAFYYFYEVGTFRDDKGKSDENKLYLGSDNSLRGTPAYNKNRKYVVSQVRRNVLP